MGEEISRTREGRKLPDIGVGGFSDNLGAGFGMIQLHAVHPQAAKVLFSCHS